jgi:hypothetical protein
MGLTQSFNGVETVAARDLLWDIGLRLFLTFAAVLSWKASQQSHSCFWGSRFIFFGDHRAQ